MTWHHLALKFLPKETCGLTFVPRLMLMTDGEEEVFYEVEPAAMFSVTGVFPLKGPVGLWFFSLTLPYAP